MRKEYPKTLAVIIVTLFSLPGIAGVRHASAASRTVTLAVENMSCGMCKYTVKKSLQKVPGVTDTQVTFDPPEAIVTFDDEKATVEDLVRATRRAGYPSEPIEKK